MKSRPSLKWIISFVLFVSSIVPSIVLGLILIYVSGEVQRDEIENSSKVISKAVAIHLEHLVEQVKNTLQIIHDSMEYGALFMEVVPYIAKNTPGRSVIKSVELLDQWKRIQVIYPLDMNKLGIDLSGLPYLKGLKEGEWVFSEVYSDPFSREPVVSLCKGIKGGYLCVDIDLKYVKRYVPSVIRPGSFELVLMDSNGLPIYHPDHRMVLERQSLANIINLQAPEQDIVHAPIVPLGEKYVGCLSLIRGTQWHLFVGQAEKKAFETMTKTQKAMLSLVFITALLASLAGFLFSRAITRPMEALRHMAEKVSRGDYGLPEGSKGYSEITEVLDAFRSMAHSIKEREERILEGQRRYKDLLENAVDPIIITDEKGEIVEVNRALLERGWREEEVIGHSVSEIAGISTSEFERIVQQLKEKGSFTFELKRVGRRGALTHYSVSARLIGGWGKEEIKIQFTFRDITELKIAYDRARISEERYKEIYDSVQDLIYTQDLEGRILSANKALWNIFGYTQEQFVGRKVSEFMKPEYRQAFETEYLAQLKEKGFYEGISQYYAKDGRRIFIQYKNVLVTDKEGNKYISGIGRDVTEQFLAQKRLQQEEKRIRTMLQTVNVPIALYNQKGEILFINQAFTNTFGWTQEEAMGKVLPEMPESEKQKNREALKRLLRTGIGEFLETKRYTKSGQEVDVITNSSIVEDPVTRSQSTVVAFHDITEFRKMERSLATAQRMEALGILAGGIAHNFNNLLMGITGNIQLLRMKLGRDHPEFKRFETIEKLIGDATSLTRQLVQFARGGKYEPRPTDLNRVIKEHDKIFATTRKEVLIQEELQEGLWPVECDTNQFKQVLMNLYINAVQAIEERVSMHGLPQAGGIITVRTQNVIPEALQLGRFQKEKGFYVKVSVSDNGKGMDEETKRKIFEPFFTTKEVGKGTGLGLASVYGIVKNHDGFIDVETKLGEGTTFHIYLPALEAETPKEEASAKEEAVVQGRGKILLVDDEKLVLDAAQEMLKELGYEVLAVDEPTEALQLFNEEKDNIDLVILDMVMPVKDGIQVLREMRLMNPKVKVLLASGYGIEPHMEELKEMGCTGVIQKPYKFSELSQVVGRMIKGLCEGGA